MATEVAKWYARDETIFIEIMADQVRKGNRATTTFVPRAWHEIAAEFKEKTGHDWKIEKLKNKFNKLRTTYREFKKLRDQPTGFGWDPVTKTMTAPDDVWENYLKINPHARQFKSKGCSNFDDLELIYGDTTATGAAARASTQPPLDSDDELIDIEGQSHNRDVRGDDYEIQEMSEARSQSRISTSCRRRKRGESSSMDNALSAFREAEEQRFEMFRSKTVKGADIEDGPYSVSKATKVMMEIPNLPISLVVKVGKAIIQDKDFREFLITFDDERRLDTLKSMFGSP